MSTIYDYQYYISGRKLAILSRGTDTEYDPNVTTTSDMWVTPTVDDTDAILLEYAYAGTTPTAESDTLDVSEYLALALVDFVKHKMYEEQGDENRSKLYYNKFLTKISRNENMKLGGPRISTPTGVCVLK